MFNKATICSLIGSIGVITTSVLSIECYKKTNESDDIKTKIKKYFPAIISGSVSITCILAAENINKKEIAALTTAAGYFAQKFTDYEKEVRSVVGNEKADEIQKSFYSKQIEKHTSQELLEDKDTFKFIDKYSGASLVAPYRNVVDALKRCEEIYGTQGHFCWCDIFFMINGTCDFYESYLGEQIGWSRGYFKEFYDDEDFDLKFYLTELGDNKFLIDYTAMPDWNFLQY